MAIALVLTGIYYVVNTIPPKGASLDAQAITIIDDASCVACHQINPAYATIPFMGRMYRKGLNRFNIGDSVEKLKNGMALNEVSLAKIEAVTITDKTMPPTFFYLTHWGASVTNAKQKILNDWIKKHREQFYPNTLAADKFKNEPVRPVPPVLVPDSQEVATESIKNEPSKHTSPSSVTKQKKVTTVKLKNKPAKPVPSSFTDNKGKVTTNKPAKHTPSSPTATRQQKATTGKIKNKPVKPVPSSLTANKGKATTNKPAKPTPSSLTANKGKAATNKPVKPVSSSPVTKQGKAATGQLHHKPSSFITYQQKVELGQKLFNDKRLSADNTVSCASCHQPEKGGANNNQYARGTGNRIKTINTPTLYNANFNIAQSWEGHADNIQEIIREHLTNAAIMGNNSLTDVISNLNTDNQPNTTPDHSLSIDDLTDAIAEYVKTLPTSDCLFDKYLKGDETTLNQMEISGYELFKSKKCATCHVGITLGGQSFELMGIYADYFSNRGWEITKEDWGRYNHTSIENDRHRFKVPGLRNVALTKPYFHDGSRQSLSEAVTIMGKYQCNKQLTDNDTNAIIAFLQTLTTTQ